MMVFIRYVLPGLICLAGIIIGIARDFDATGLEGMFSLLGAGLAVGLLNVFFRIGVSGDHERDAEEQARDFFSRHGHWPDES